MADEPPSELERALTQELERRISQLATSDAAAVGSIGAWDALLVVVLFFLLPLVCIWWAA